MDHHVFISPSSMQVLCITDMDDTTNIFCFTLKRAFNRVIINTHEIRRSWSKSHMPHTCDESYTRINIRNWQFFFAT